MTTAPPPCQTEELLHGNQNVEKTKCVIQLIKHKFAKKDAARTIFFGLVTSIAGLAILFIQPHIYFRSYYTTLPKGSLNFDLWSKPRSLVLLKIHIFNITNAEAFLAGSEKLKFEDVGPYVYKEIYEQQNEEFDNENGTVTTHPSIVLHKISTSENEHYENETVVAPNIALLALGNKVAKNFLLKLPFNGLVMQTSSKPIITQTAKDYMFGYDDPLISLAHTAFPSWIFFKKLGIIDRITDTKDDTETTYTGEKDLLSSGTLAKYNGFPNLPYWTAPCNKVEGASNGLKFHNEIQPNETLYLHYKIFCRRLALVPMSGIENSEEGIPVVHYKFADYNYDYGEQNEQNKCFCKRGVCPTKGLTDASDCFYGFSLTVSHPHFYDADPALLESFEGLKPNREQHESYFHINPHSGIVVRLHLRLQVNLVLGDLSGIKCCDKFSNLTIPLAWAELSNPSLDPTTVILLLLLLRVNPAVELIIASLLLLTGILCFLSLKVSIRIFRKKSVERNLTMTPTNTENKYVSFVKKPEANSEKNTNPSEPLLSP